MIVTLGSVRGAPGVTSWSMLLAAAWPGTGAERVVLEADPDGGVIAARYGFGVEPGVISLAASLRRTEAGDLELGEHGRQVAPNVLVIPSPESPERCTAIWNDTAAPMAASLAADRDRIWFVDAGRYRMGAPAEAFVAHSSISLLLSLAGPEDVVQLRGTVARLSDLGVGRVAVVLVGKPAHDVDEIKTFLGAEHLWTVPASRNLPADTAAAFAGRAGRRSWLWRAAVSVASEMATLTTVDALRGANA